MPTTHILGPLIESLEKQTFKSFELIVVDALHQFRQNLFRGQCFNADKLPFTVKHLPPHPNHRFWHNRQRPCSCAQFNTGLINASGELIVKVDDCCQFSEDYLANMWQSYLGGYFPLAMHVRYLNGQPAFYNEEYRQKAVEHYKQLYGREHGNGVLKRYEQVYGENGLVRDTRWKTVEANGGQMIAHKNWFYGYSSLPLEAALKVNGMDELMDGDYTLMDVDLGQRLVMAGYKDKFALSRGLWVAEHCHVGHSVRAINPNCGVVKCNYSILKLNEKKGRWKANSDRLNAEDLAFVKQETLRKPCSWLPKQYLDDCEGPMFNLWASNQPLFNLREERKQVVP